MTQIFSALSEFCCVMTCYLFNFFSEKLSKTTKTAITWNNWTYSALLNFLIFLTLEVPHLLDDLRKRLNFHINIQPGLKRLFDGLLDLSYYWLTSPSFFSFPQYKFLVLGVIITFIKQNRSLKFSLLQKNGKNIN